MTLGVVTHLVLQPLCLESSKEALVLALLSPPGSRNTVESFLPTITMSDGCV